MRVSVLRVVTARRAPALARWISSANKTGGIHHDHRFMMDEGKEVLQVEAIGARELFKRTPTTVDPYLKLTMGNTTYQTEVVKRTSDPVWGSKHFFDFSSDDDQLVAEVWDQETFGADVMLGVARTSVAEIKKAQKEAESLGKREVETFFHLVPADSSSSTWVSSVIERSLKAGSEAVKIVKKTYASAAGITAVDTHEGSIPPQGHGRLYLKFRIGALQDLVVTLPHVVPPAAIPVDSIRSLKRKTLSEWNEGQRPPNRMFRIISLDGGGVRGVMTAGILRRLVKTNRFPTLLQDADMIAGTSTGGILALLFAAGYTPAQAQALYTHHCPKIFTSSPARRYSPFISKYLPGHLEQMLLSYFKDLTLDELPQPVVITSFRIRSNPEQTAPTFFGSRGKSWSPVLFSNMLQYEGPVGPDKLPVAHIACRASAAPTYFPSYQNYVDGAIYANNPVLCAIAKATSHLRHVQPNRVAVLSLGSGEFDYFIPEEKQQDKKEAHPAVTQDWGLRQWAPYLRSILLDSSAISLDTNMQLMIGHRYRRLNPHLPREIDLDDFSAIPELNRYSREVDLKETERWIREVYYREWADEAG